MSSIVKEWKSRPKFKLRYSLDGFLVGVVVGLLIVAFRLAVEHLQEGMKELFGLAHQGWSYALAFFFLYLLLGLIGGICSQWEPMIAGSGIPQVSGQLAGLLNFKWYRVLLGKVFGGLITLGSGLTLGREGPSVQMGACCGEGLASVLKRPDSEKKYFISTGAAAGLAAAFSAPISGALFALEEIHRNFSNVAFISAMTGAITADFISKQIFGLAPELSFIGEVKSLPLNQYHWILLLGLLVGLMAILFNRGILLVKSWYDALKIPVWLKAMIPFVVSFFVIFWQPSFFSAGQSLIALPLEGNLPLLGLTLYYFVKLALVLVAFCSGLPGGIFFPLLVLGALLGNLYGTALHQWLGLPAEYLMFFIVLAMAAHFSAIVRAPGVGILLIFEMTGQLESLLPVMLVSLIAYLTAEGCHLPPIYEALLHNLLKKQALKRRQQLEQADEATEKQNPTAPEPHQSGLRSRFRHFLSRCLGKQQERPQGWSRNTAELVTEEEKMLLEFAVQYNSEVDGKKIAEVQWPKQTLIVGVKRSGEELIPGGQLKLCGGDYLLVLLNRKDWGEVDERLHQLCDEGL